MTLRTFITDGGLPWFRRLAESITHGLALTARACDYACHQMKRGSSDAMISSRRKFLKGLAALRWLQYSRARKRTGCRWHFLDPGFPNAVVEKGYWTLPGTMASRPSTAVFEGNLDLPSHSSSPAEHIERQREIRARKLRLRAYAGSAFCTSRFGEAAKELGATRGVFIDLAATLEPVGVFLAAKRVRQIANSERRDKKCPRGRGLARTRKYAVARIGPWLIESHDHSFIHTRRREHRRRMRGADSDTSTSAGLSPHLRDLDKSRNFGGAIGTLDPPLPPEDAIGSARIAILLIWGRGNVPIRRQSSRSDHWIARFLLFSSAEMLLASDLEDPDIANRMLRACSANA